VLQAYRTKIVRLSNGERLPLLLKRCTGMPVVPVCDYSLTYHRGLSPNASRQDVDAIGIFYSWAEDRRIDLSERFESGNLFTSDEVTSLSEAMWHKRPRDLRRRQAAAPEAVIGETHGNRSDRVAHYIEWRLGHWYR
jgi:hypothetical protein